MQSAEIVDTKDLRQSPSLPAMDLPHRRSLAFVCVVTILAGLTIGAVVAYLALRGSAARLDAMTRNSYEEDEAVTETLLEEVDRQTLFKARVTDQTQ